MLFKYNIELLYCTHEHVFHLTRYFINKIEDNDLKIAFIIKPKLRKSMKDDAD